MYNCCAGESNDKDENTGPSAGAIVGIVIGSLIAFIIVVNICIRIYLIFVAIVWEEK